MQPAMQVAFDGLGSMPMARIDNFRQIKQEVVDDEMRKRANRSPPSVLQPFVCPRGLAGRLRLAWAAGPFANARGLHPECNSELVLRLCMRLAPWPCI